MKKPITYEKAIAIFKEQYERAKKLEYVRKPLAYALYQAWEIVDEKEVSK